MYVMNINNGEKCVAIEYNFEIVAARLLDAGILLAQDIMF